MRYGREAHDDPERDDQAHMDPREARQQHGGRDVDEHAPSQHHLPAKAPLHPAARDLRDDVADEERTQDEALGLLVPVKLTLSSVNRI